MVQPQARSTAMFGRAQLIESELETLYHASRMLSRSLDLKASLLEILKLLNDKERMQRGLIGLIDEATELLHINFVHYSGEAHSESVTYRPGEGIVGQILHEKDTVVIPCIADEPKFLGKLGLYDVNLPFIGVPLFVGSDQAVGVLAVQPPAGVELLGERARFVEMIANLIMQTLRLHQKVENDRKELADERDNLRRTVKRQHGFDSVIGSTRTMRAVFDQVRLVAKWDTTVLLRGESGTGKELIANALHFNSSRAGGPFVKLNCAALPDNLLESELFGHEKGAFTGATQQRKGRFEQANGGTLFLDEIGEVSASFQAKLLRVLQEGEFERLGGNKTHTVDVRIIAATNKDLEQAVENDSFREDVYYRLNVMPIVMPALRERLEDVPELAAFLVSKIEKKQGRKLAITDSAVRLLLRHTWPGNVRELENALERAAILCEGGTIDRGVIEASGVVANAVLGPSHGSHGSAAAPSPPSTGADPHSIDFTDPSVDERERVIAALEEAGWVQAKAARLLNMTPRQIAYRIQNYKIKVRQI